MADHGKTYRVTYLRGQDMGRKLWLYEITPGDIRPHRLSPPPEKIPQGNHYWV